MATKEHSLNTEQLENDFVVIPLEQTGDTDDVVLKCLIEIGLISVGGVPHINNFNFEATKAKFKKLFSWETYFITKRAGSTMDLLFITKYNTLDDGHESTGYKFNTDIDMLFIPSTVSVANNDELVTENTVAIIEPTQHTSYINLRYNELTKFPLPDEILSETPKGNGKYVSSQKLLKVMEGYMNVVQDAVEIVGPSLAVKPERVKNTKGLMTSVDIVFAFRNDDWPTLGMDWITRKRPNPWPPEQDLQELLTMGSHVVAKSNKLSPPSEAEIQWKLSFNIAERRLAELLDSKQRYCFLIVKAIVKDSRSKALSSYSLKNVLWWMIECSDPNIWSKESIDVCLRSYLDEIMKSVAKHEIKNYFMPGENLIGHISKGELGLINQRLEKARSSPISAILGNTILTENPRKIFSMTPDNDFHYSELELKLRNYKGEPDLRKDVLRIFQYHFINLGAAFVVDPNTGDRAIRFLQLFAGLNNPDGDDMEFVKNELFEDAMKGISNGAQTFAYSCLAVLATHFHVDTITSMLPRDSWVEILLINTACLLHGWSKKTFLHIQRQRNLRICEELFKYVQRMNPSNSICLAEYAHFLLVHDRLHEAFLYAKKSFELAESTSSYMQYDRVDQDVIDTNIARHVQHENIIEAPPHIFGLYIGIVAKARIGEKEPAREFIPRLLKACQSIRTKPAHKYHSFSLAGYACMSLGLYRDAKKCFFEAVKVKQSDLQDENIEICNNMTAKLKSVPLLAEQLSEVVIYQRNSNGDKLDS